MKHGLGKGLYDLMKEDDMLETNSFFNSENNLILIPLANIEPNPNQPRKTYDVNELEDLALSIKENGVLQPIIVRRKAGKADSFELIAGERRWKASEIALLDKIPAIVKTVTDKDMMIIALIENLQREDMNAIDSANGFNILMGKYNFSHDEIGKIIGKSRSYVTNMLRLLKLPPNLQLKLRNKEISPSLARTIITCSDFDKVEELLSQENITVKDIEKLKEKEPKKMLWVSDKKIELLKMEDELKTYFKLPVKINHKKMGNYEMVIKINSIEKLKELIYHQLIKN